MANITSSFKKASELYQRAVLQYQTREKEQKALIDQFKVGDVHTKTKLKPQLIAIHKDMQYHQQLVNRAEAAFEKALAMEPVDLGEGLNEDDVVKNKKTGNVYTVKSFNPNIHSKPTPAEVEKAKNDVETPKSDGMDTVKGIASQTGLRAPAVAGWADENGVNLSKVADDLKSKKLKPMDFMTAVVGNVGNKYAKQIISKYSNEKPTEDGPKLNIGKTSDIPKISPKMRSMVSMKINELVKETAAAKAAGDKAPNFNLCKITIPGTNLYCEGNKGIPREDMPQFKGYARPGSIADKLPKDPRSGEVDTEAQFKVLLKRNNVGVSKPMEVPADQLRATQTELVGSKVAGMSKALEEDPNNPNITAPIYVSNDGYVLDGHHRWAAVTSNAITSGKPAMMKVVVIDMPIKDLVKVSNQFADDIGIQQKKADANAEAPTKKEGMDEVTTNDWHYKVIMAIYDKAGSFTKKKIGTIVCKDPNASRKDIDNQLRDSDYNEITDFTDHLKMENVVNEIASFIPNVGTIDNYKLKSLLQKNLKVKSILGPNEFKFLTNSNTDVIMVSGKPYNSITTDGKNEFEIDLKKNILVKSLRKARPAIVSHYTNKMRESVNEVASFIPNVGTIDNYKLKSLLQKNPKVKSILGPNEFKFLTNPNTDVIMVSGKPFNTITTDGKNEFEIDLKKNILVKSLRNARPAIVSHYTNKMRESVNEIAVSDAAYAIHRITGNGQDAVQHFINDNNIDGEKLSNHITSQIHRNPKIRYDIRDIINGTAMRDSPSATKMAIKKFIKQFVKKSVKESVNEAEGDMSDESRMAKSGIQTAIEASTSIQQILESKGDNFDVPAWIQSYIALASDYLHSVNEYYKSNTQN